MMLDHRITNGIQARKLIRPRTDTSIRIGVIAANTSWKETSVGWLKLNAGPVVIDGIAACVCSAPVPRTDAGVPHMALKKPVSAPKMCMGLPKANLNP